MTYLHSKINNDLGIQLFEAAAPNETISYKDLISAILNQIHDVYKGDDIQIIYSSNSKLDVMNALIILPLENCAVHVQHSYNKSIKTQATYCYYSDRLETVLALSKFPSVVFKKAAAGMSNELPTFAKDVLAMIRDSKWYSLGNDYVSLLESKGFTTDSAINSLLGTLYFQSDTLSPTQGSLLKTFLFEDGEKSEYLANRSMLCLFNKLSKAIFDTAPKAWLKDHMALSTIYLALLQETMPELPESVVDSSATPPANLIGKDAVEDAGVKFDEVEEVEEVVAQTVVDPDPVSFEEIAENLELAQESPEPIVEKRNVEIPKRPIGNGMLSGMFQQQVARGTGKTVNALVKAPMTTEQIENIIEEREAAAAVEPAEEVLTKSVVAEEDSRVNFEELENEMNAVETVEKVEAIETVEDADPIAEIEATEIEPIIDANLEDEALLVSIPTAELHEDPALEDKDFDLGFSEAETPELSIDEQEEEPVLDELQSIQLSYFGTEKFQNVVTNGKFAAYIHENGALIQ